MNRALAPQKTTSERNKNHLYLLNSASFINDEFDIEATFFVFCWSPISFFLLPIIVKSHNCAIHDFNN